MAEEGEAEPGRRRVVPGTRHKKEKKLAEARRTASQPSVARNELPSPTRVTAPETAVSADQPTSTPDASWTVVRLRQEARARGLTGMSGKPKAEVLAALT